MAIEYLRVFKSLNLDVILVARSRRNFTEIKSKFNNVELVFQKDIRKINKIKFLDVNFAVNCVSISNLYDVTNTLLELGIRNILIEKPGCLEIKEIETLIKIKNTKKVNVYIAFNRRFFNSVISLKKILHKKEITSAKIDFTEWIKGIENQKYSKKTLEKWLYSNTIHIIDLFFYLLGEPIKLNTNLTGENNLSWHPTGSLFFGNGMLKNNIPFTYHADWNGPGRWSIEIVTSQHKYILSPLEIVQFQTLNNFIIKRYSSKDIDDQEFKPGLKKMVTEFLKENFSVFQTLEKQKKLFKILNKLGNYDSK